MSSSFRSRAIRRSPSIGSIGALVALAVAPGACTSTTPRSDRGSGEGGGDPTPAKGIAQLGIDCTGACGSADDRKCAVSSDVCESDLCLIDPTQPIAHLAYCSVDCTNSPCPAGWRCEEIKSFGDPSVLRGCVAEPPVCGDAVVQLGEVCDGNGDGTQGTCVDCMGWQGVCGDKVVQEGEVCDGDSPEGYCSVDCKNLTKPYITFSSIDIEGFLSPDNVQPVVAYKGSVTALLPDPGDAQGCGKLDILENTADATRIAWTYCDPVKGTSATLTFSLPKKKLDYSGYKDMPDELEGSIRLRDPGLGKDVTMGPEQGSYEFSFDGDANIYSSDVDASHKANGNVYFRFREYQPNAGDYNVAYFTVNYSWLLPP